MILIYKYFQNIAIFHLKFFDKNPKVKNIQIMISDALALMTNFEIFHFLLLKTTLWSMYYLTHFRGFSPIPFPNFIPSSQVLCLDIFFNDVLSTKFKLQDKITFWFNNFNRIIFSFLYVKQIWANIHGNYKGFIDVDSLKD